MPQIDIQALDTDISPEVMMEKIGQEKYQSLKGKGVLQAFALAHEGTSNPRQIGKGKVSLTWGQKVIQKLASAVKTGTKFLIGHGTTNSHTGRKPVGEVVASFVKNVAGKLTDVIIGHFPDKDMVAKMDVVSMEANIQTDNDNNVTGIKDVSGVAMGSSDKDSPAFAGAVRLASIQCFGGEPEEIKTLDKRTKTMTYEEYVAAPFDFMKRSIAERVIHPHQLYTEDDMKKDNKFSKVFTERDNAVTKVTEQAKTLETLEAKATEWTKAEGARGAQAIFDKAIETGLTEKQKLFITRSFKAESLEDATETGVSKWLDEAKAEYSAQAKLFGVAEEIPPTIPPLDNGQGADTPDNAVDELMEEMA